MATAARAGTSGSHRPHQPPAPAAWQAPHPLPARFETQRLVLRFWREADAADLLNAVGEDRRSFLPWLSCFRDDYRTIGECHYHIERFQRQHRRPHAQEYIMGAFDREDGSVVGGTGFYKVDHEDHQAEIGYWLRPSRRGEGLCTEMVRGLITWSFLPPRDSCHEARSGAASRAIPHGWGLRRLEIYCAGHNFGSRRIPETLGLRKEYHGRAARWMEGFGWDDTLGWAVLADEWDCQTQSPRRPSSHR